MLELGDHPHRRYNPLTAEWVLVSPHRAKRPWQGQTEEVVEEQRPHYDPNCYLCPGNKRASGDQNPDYATTYAFDNDFAALLPDVAPGDLITSAPAGGPPLLHAQSERGTCRVVCFSPRHDLTVGQLAVADIRAVVDTWAAQVDELRALPFINYVQIFENRGAMMGASNPHPHCQIWATESIPMQVAREQTSQTAYLAQTGRTLLSDYLELELAAEERLVCANDTFVALVPFWAVWPFETIVICRRPVPDLRTLTDAERTGLADILKQLVTRYDALFGVTFPYSMGLHQQPCDGAEHPEWHLHAHFYPPLLRSATVRKFMVGFELLGEAQRDITAEVAAARLRDVQLKGDQHA